MAGKKWCIKVTPLYEKPGGKRRNISLSENTIYDLTGEQQVFSNKLWTEVRFTDRNGVQWQGWIQDVYLEDYCDDPNSQGFEVFIANPTPDSTDAAQYMKWEGDARYNNMCGELCVAFIAGEDIETFLTKWKRMEGSFYKNIIPKDRGTSPDEVNNMLKVYGYPGKLMSFQQGLANPDVDQKKGKLSPGRFQRMLTTHYLIAAVEIETAAGNIVGSGAGHWVVVDKVIPEGIDRGWVEIYNPFPNKRQVYSYDEFIRSCNAQGWTGLWVERNVPSHG